jgi:GNAT superfamily N-acetyltransferase
MDFSVRKAKETDASAILGLIRELAVYEKQPDAVVIAEKDIIDAAFGDHPLTYIFVAEVNSNVVGIALFYYGFSTWKGRSLHLEDLIVNENFRGHGIGKALMMRVVQVAQKEKLNRMDWEVLDWNEPAMKFYESLGTSFYSDWNLCRLFGPEIQAIKTENLQ